MTMVNAFNGKLAKNRVQTSAIYPIIVNSIIILAHYNQETL